MSKIVWQFVFETSCFENHEIRGTKGDGGGEHGEKDEGNRKGTGSQSFPLLPRVLFRPFVVKGTRLTVELVDRTE